MFCGHLIGKGATGRCTNLQHVVDRLAPSRHQLGAEPTALVSDECREIMQRRGEERGCGTSSATSHSTNVPCRSFDGTAQFLISGRSSTTRIFTLPECGFSNEVTFHHLSRANIRRSGVSVSAGRYHSGRLRAASLDKVCKYAYAAGNVNGRQCARKVARQVRPRLGGVDGLHQTQSSMTRAPCARAKPVRRHTAI